MTTLSRRATPRFAALIGLYALSGAAALIDQVCFEKYFSYVVGATAYAASAVLAAFMTGLALGATLGGALSSRVRRPIVAYGVVELAAGALVALTPVAFRALTPLYASAAHRAGASLGLLFSLRWATATLIIALPTAAIGATLPLVASLLPSNGDHSSPHGRGRRLMTLYAANTFGGAAGALGAAYALLPALGLSKTLYFGAALNSLSGIGAWRLGRDDWGARTVFERPSESREGPGSTPRDGAPEFAWLIVLAFASGGLAFALEVVATHLLAVIVGTSAYAFGVILAAFLACLFLGASIAPRFSRGFGRTALAASLALTGFAVMATLPFWDELPIAFATLSTRIGSFYGREAVRGSPRARRHVRPHHHGAQ